jgi:FkbM family methyltransferase
VSQVRDRQRVVFDVESVVSRGQLEKDRPIEMGLFRRRSIKGFIQTRRLKRRLEQPPVVVRQKVADIEIAFSVHTWVEYHNRAQLSYGSEPDMVEWLRENLRDHDVLWDVGANVGAYSLLAARLIPSSTVISFEPYIPTFSHLWENVVLNGLTGQVIPLCLALSDKTVVDRLGVSDPRAGSSEHRLGGKDFKVYQFSSAVTGDEAKSQLGVVAPTLIKIDVDGFEINVLNGMVKILRQNSLRSCIIEVERGKTESSVDDIMKASRFSRVSDSSRVSGSSVFNIVYTRVGRIKHKSRLTSTGN